jgi:predicted MFS family arabinose efflux permease
MKIFLSYRQADAVQALRDVLKRLEHEFGAENVFHDTDVRNTGKPFPPNLTAKIQEANVVIAAIGQVLGSMSSVAVFVTVSSLTVIAIVLVMDEEVRPHQHSPSRWFPPPVLLPGILLGLGNVTYAAMAGFLVLLLPHHGHGAAWAFPAFAAAVLFGRAVFGGLPDRMGPRRSLFAGYACLAVGLIAILAGHSSVLALPAASLVGLGYAFPWPALATVVVGQVPVTERAAALGALNAFYDLFVAASSAIAGAAAGQWGLTAPFWMALACVGSAATLVVISGIGKGFKALREHIDKLAQLSIGADPVA